MPQFTVKWIVEGEKIVEAETLEGAEQAVHKELVAVLTDPARWPAELGTQSVQGAGHETGKPE